MRNFESFIATTPLATDESPWMTASSVAAREPRAASPTTAPTWDYREIPRQPTIERPEDAPRVKRPRVQLPPQEPAEVEPGDADEHDEYFDAYRLVRTRTSELHREFRLAERRARQRAARARRGRRGRGALSDSRGQSSKSPRRLTAEEVANLPGRVVFVSRVRAPAS